MKLQPGNTTRKATSMDSMVRYIGLLGVEVRTLKRAGEVELGVLRAVAEMMTVGQPTSAHTTATPTR